MTQEFKVLAFDGLGGTRGTRGCSSCGGFGESPLLPTALLAAGSTVYIRPEQRADGSQSTRIVVRVPISERSLDDHELEVDRPILAHLILDARVRRDDTLAPTPNGLPVVRNDESTALELHEPVSLYDLEDGSTRDLGVGVQIALPLGMLLGVEEAGAGSTGFLSGDGGTDPVPPGPDVPEVRRAGIPKWIPIVGGIALLLTAGWLVLGGKKKDE